MDTVGSFIYFTCRLIFFFFFLSRRPPEEELSKQTWQTDAVSHLTQSSRRFALKSSSSSGFHLNRICTHGGWCKASTVSKIKIMIATDSSQQMVPARLVSSLEKVQRLCLFSPKSSANLSITTAHLDVKRRFVGFVTRVRTNADLLFRQFIRFVIGKCQHLSVAELIRRQK